jgi:phosphatidylinositol alpha-mannosyltransferase
MFEYAGGVQEVVIHLAQGLRERGHEVRIITPRPNSNLAPHDDQMILLGQSRKMNTPFATMVDFGFEAEGKEIDAMLEREKFDLIHFHEPWVPFLSRQIINRSSAVHVATFHAKLPETITGKSIMSVVSPYTKSFLKDLDALTAVSEAAAEYIRSITVDNITIVPNGIDLTRYHNIKSISPSTGTKMKTIAYVGRLESRKGIEWLIRAFGELQTRRRDVELVIAGKGVKLRSLQRLAESLKITNISFPGFIDDNAKIELISRADIFSSPALFGESFGIVLLEAMALGTPIVAGNNSGYASVLTGTGRLSLVDPRKTIEYTDRLDLLLDDERLRSAWQDWAATNIGQYAYPNIIDDYIPIYEAALTQGRGN